MHKRPPVLSILSGVWIAAICSAQERPAGPKGPEQPPAVAAEEARGGPPPSAEVSVLPLQHAPAREIADLVAGILPGLGGPIRIACDERTNSIIVAADAERVLPRVEALIKQLDREPVPGREPEDAIQSLQLDAASADEVAENLRHLRSQRVGVRIVADRRANTLWVGGDPATVKQYLEIAGQMDRSATQTGSESRAEARELRFYHLKEANAASVSQTVAKAADIMGLGAAILADPPSDTLLAFAAPTAHDRLAQIIVTLDVAPQMPERGQPRGPQPQPQPQPTP